MEASGIRSARLFDDVTKQLRVRRAVFQSGERFPYLVQSTGFPVSLPFRYALARLRLRMRANSKERAMRSIGLFYDWAASVSRRFDPEIRLRSGPLLDPVEVSSLAAYVRHFRKLNVVLLPSKQRERAAERLVRTNPDTNNHLRYIRGFLVWAAETQTVPRPESRAIADLTKRINAQLVGGRQGEQRRGLSVELEQRMIEIARPGSPQNPFLPRNQLRNWLIVSLLRETGIRRGELCKLWVGDVRSVAGQSAIVSVVRRPDDINDPRVNEPQVKTRDRRIPVGAELHRDIIQYLRTSRGRHRHPYLFTDSATGHPLDLCTINRIVGSIRNVSTELVAASLTPHTLRYTFVDRIAAEARKQGFNDQQCKDVLNYLGGWSPMSNQAAHYHVRETEQTALELVERLQTMNSDISAVTALG